MILYFVIMWTSTFAGVYYLSRRESDQNEIFGYEMAVVQAFTAGSNNFVSTPFDPPMRMALIILLIRSWR